MTLASSVTYPIDVVISRTQYCGKEHQQYKGMSDALRTILREEKLRGLYRGFTAFWLRLVVGNIGTWTLYEMLRPRNNEDDERWNVRQAEADAKKSALL